VISRKIEKNEMTKVISIDGFCQKKWAGQDKILGSSY
jgi:hypothetical protein